jgi:hypothetical protein
MGLRSSKNGQFFVDDENSPHWLSSAAAGNFTVSSANTAVQLTIAAVTGCAHDVRKIIVSFSADPTAAVPVTIMDGSTAKGVFYITKGGPAPIDLDGFLGTVSTAFAVQIGAAGGTTTGSIFVNKRRVVTIGKD